MSDFEMDLLDNGSDDSEGSSQSEKEAANSHTEICLFGNTTVELPLELVESKSIFNEVISASTWQSDLTEDQRKHLMKFLPKFEENDAEQKHETVQQLLSHKNMKFGAPLKQFHKKLKDGSFSPDIARYAALARKAKQREYRYQQQVYYAKLLKDVLISRQKILDHISKHPVDEPLNLMSLHMTAIPKESGVSSRSKRRYAKILTDLRQEHGKDGDTSDEEDLLIYRARRPSSRSQSGSGADGQTDPCVVSTFATVNDHMLTPSGEQTQNKSKNALQRQHIPEITDIDYRNMLQKHKRRKRQIEDLPEFDTEGLSLQDIIHRTQPSKKALMLLSGAAKKKTPRLTMEKKKTTLMGKEKMTVLERPPTVVPDESIHTAVTSSVNCVIQTEEQNQDVNVDEIEVDVFDDESNLPSYLTNGSASFFSLLRDIIVKEPEQKIHAQKLEDKVKEWQESPRSAINSWYCMESNWVKLVHPAAKFLSGDIMGLEMENFIPLLDFKERMQHWKWIGKDRDDDSDLLALYEYWSENRQLDDTDAGDSRRSGSPLPPRVTTDYKVCPSSEKDKRIFRLQEAQRFSKPHTSYTYRLHGYEAVVGPVKGIYSNELGHTKAREHALLSKDRPPFVTILTLTREAAARLPNGEGTRSDICELMLDSQYLAPNVTEAAINGAVSGALDRLHYEKDPSVKFDTNRKIWIYLHRYRSEEEAARVHEAQGAAAKAKKSLLKPKLFKKSKDGTAGLASAGQPANLGSKLLNSASVSVVNTSLATLGATTVRASTPVVNVTTKVHSKPIRPPVRVATPNTVMSQPQSLPLKSPGSTTIPPGYSIVPGGPGNKPMLVQSPMTPEGQKIVTIATTSILSAVNTVSAVAKPGATPTSPSVVISNATGKVISQQQVVGTSASSLTATTIKGAGRAGQRVTLTSQRMVQPGGMSVGVVGSAGGVTAASTGVRGQTPRQPSTVTISSLIAARQQNPAMFKIQGNNVLQTIGGKPLSVQKLSAEDVLKHSQSGKPTQIIATQGGKPGQIISAQGGKPGQFLSAQSGKPGQIISAQSGKPGQIMSAQGGKPGQIITKPGQVIGSSGQVISEIKSTTGKPVQITAGKTQQITPGQIPAHLLAPGAGGVQQILIDGKPHIISGKPAAVLGAKPATVIGGKPTAVLAGKPASMIGGKPTSMLAGKPAAMLGGKPIRLIRGHGGQQVIVQQAPGQVTAGTPVSVTTPTTPGNQSALLSHLVRAGSNIQIQRPVTGAVRPTTGVRPQPGVTTVRPVTSPQVVTQIRGAGLQPGQIGQRIILSSSQAGGSPQIINQQLISGTPGIRSAVLGQQTTQTGQSIQIMRTPQQITRTTGSPVGRGGKPVYARIITQTPGMRITQVRPTTQTTQVTSVPAMVQPQSIQAIQGKPNSDSNK